MRARLVIGLALGLALTGTLVGPACSPAAEPQQGAVRPASDAVVTINGQPVEVEIARTAREQERGLGYRDALAWNDGMLFVYEKPALHRFWMKGMRFDIDIVWIRSDRIIDISHRVPHVPGGNGPTVQPRELADSVLEVPAGYALSHGWRIGNRVEVEPQQAASAPR